MQKSCCFCLLIVNYWLLISADPFGVIKACGNVSAPSCVLPRGGPVLPQRGGSTRRRVPLGLPGFPQHGPKALFFRAYFSLTFLSLLGPLSVPKLSPKCSKIPPNITLFSTLTFWYPFYTLRTSKIKFLRHSAP